MAVNIPLDGDTRKIVQEELQNIQIPGTWIPVNLTTDEKPTDPGEVGKIYHQPNGIMWYWSEADNDYFQINGLTDLSAYSTTVEVNQAISDSSDSLKEYVDEKVGAFRLVGKSSIVNDNGNISIAYAWSGDTTTSLFAQFKTGETIVEHTKAYSPELDYTLYDVVINLSEGEISSSQFLVNFYTTSDLDISSLYYSDTYNLPDTEVTANSYNLVTSGGVYKAIQELKAYTEEELEAKINDLVNTSKTVSVDLNTTYGETTEIAVSSEDNYKVGDLVFDENGVGGIVESIDGSGLMVVRTVITISDTNVQSTSPISTEVNGTATLNSSTFIPNDALTPGMIVWDSNGSIGYISDISGTSVTVTTMSVSSAKSGITDEERAKLSNIDKVPTDGSTNLVESNGVYDATHYVIETPVGQKTLAEASVGDDLSNVIVTFDRTVTGTRATMKEVYFTNGCKIGFSVDGQSWGLYDENGDYIPPEWYVTGSAREDSVTIPDGFIVSDVPADIDTEFTRAISFTPNPIKTIIDFEDLYNEVQEAKEIAGYNLVYKRINTLDRTKTTSISMMFKGDTSSTLFGTVTATGGTSSPFTSVYLDEFKSTSYTATIQNVSAGNTVSITFSTDSTFVDISKIVLMETYIVIGDSVDEVATAGSINKVTSDTVSKKSDIYLEVGTTTVKRLDKLVVGDDISGSTLGLPSIPSTIPAVRPYAGFRLSNGLWYGYTASGWGVYENYETIVYLASADSQTWNTEDYVFPEGSVVVTADNNMFSFTAFTESSISATSKDMYYDCEELRKTDIADEALFTTHRNTDMVRWNSAYQTDLRTYLNGAKIEGLVPYGDPIAITISSVKTVSYTCSFELGGIIAFSLENEDGVFGKYYINSVEQPHIADGLPNGVPIVSYCRLNYGDQFSATQCIKAEITPLEEDPNRLFASIAEMNNGDSINATNLQAHINSDEDRWQSTLDYMVAMEARILQKTQDMISGTTLPLDYGNPTLVMGNGGLVNLLDGQQWTAPVSGAIVCASGGLLSVAYSVLINGVSVWDSPLYALGIKIGGGESPSPEIPINAGDVVTASGLLSVGSPINVTFYRNKV